MSAAPSEAQPPKKPWGHANIARQQQLFAASPRSKARLRKYRENKVGRGISMSGIQKRATQQLATVYKALQGDHSHPSAVEIYQRVRQTLPRISLGTVYRNLQRLVEERKIRMVLLGERVARYDPVLAAHDHFICQQCGRVEDLLLEQGHQVNLQPLIGRGFTVLTHSLAIHGLCQQCGQVQGRKSRTKRAQGSSMPKAGTAELRERRKSTGVRSVKPSGFGGIARLWNGR